MRDLVDRLGIDHRPVLLVCGNGEGSDDGKRSAGAEALGRAVADAVRRTRAIVLDSGADAGISKQLGEVRSGDAAAIPALVAVAPAAAGAQLEPHHTHAVLADVARRGQATPLLFELADALSDGSPVAALLAGGDDVARAHALEAIRRGLPLVVVTGTGGSADSISAAHAHPRHIRDVELRAVIPGADIRTASISDGDSLDLTWRLVWALNDDRVLQGVWKLFGTYDAAAKKLRRTFRRFQAAILLLGILATLLALLYRDLQTAPMRWGVIIVPMVISGLIALAGHRAAGNRWVVLRGAAESVKSEIFCYRANAGSYTAENLAKHKKTRPATLADRVGRIEKHLAHTEASCRELAPYDGPLPPMMYGAARTDDGLHDLTAKEYLELRVADQMRFYRGRTSELERWGTRFQYLAIGASSAGVLVAAAGAQTWVALTTVISAAPLAYLAHMQVETTIVAYNHSLARLEGIERRCHAHEQAGEPQDIRTLVKDAEAVLTSERGGWVAHMSEALRAEEAQQHEKRAEP